MSMNSSEKKKQISIKNRTEKLYLKMILKDTNVNREKRHFTMHSVNKTFVY